MLLAPAELVSFVVTTTTEADVKLRGYRPGDRADIYDVCVRTGAAGEDATGKFQRPELLGDIYAGPYVEHEPGLAFVLEAGGRAVGYILGTADTKGFVEWYSSSWIPRFGDGYEEPKGSPATPDEGLLVAFHHPERMLMLEAAQYPAHLHIDILAPYQGAGWGRRLIEAFLDAVAAAGAPAVHLAVAATNTRAQGFYRRLGFEQLDVAGMVGSLVLVRSTSR